MKFILGMIVRNEFDMLSKTLPAMTECRFTGRFAIDTGSTDGTETLLRKAEFLTGHSLWKSNYAEVRNELLCTVNSFFSDGWLLMLDADECMYCGCVDTLREVCARSTADLITLPRYNLAKGGEVWEHGSYPDKQPRVLRLGAPLEFRHAVHETVYYIGHKDNIPGEGRDEFSRNTHIYHYGWCKPPANNWLRSHRYTQIAKGEPEIETAPDWANVSEEEFLKDLGTRHKLKEFTQEHPLKARS